MDKPTAWEKILEHLKSRIDERDFETWFRDTKQRHETPEVISVQVRAPLYVSWISENFASQISESAQLAGLGGREIRFGADGDASSTVATAKGPALVRKKAGALNPAYTFENFVTGNSNRLAHAAALRVAEHGTRQYNPLFVCGGAGLGKTHLMHAIGHRRLSRQPGDKVLYLTSETFVNEVVLGVRFNRMEA
ncbi:MAG TPA: DnaA/Hda family protein, partial [Thermoanaerobaculia bacterium]